MEIQVFKLGFVGDVDLGKVVCLINDSQNVFRGVIGDSVSNIGDPDLFDATSYSDGRLFGLFPPDQQDVIRVGIVLAPIQNNFYTRSLFPGSMVLSLFQTQEICETSRRTVEEYIVISLVMHLLWLQFKMRDPDAEYQDLFHKDVRGCLFDYTIHKPDKVHKLKSGQIDLRCKAKLIQANVPGSIISGAESILKRVNRTTFLDSLAEGLNNPIFSFLFGGLCLGVLINFVTSVAFEHLGSATKYYVLGGLIVLLVMLATGNYLWIVLKNRKKQLH